MPNAAPKEMVTQGFWDEIFFNSLSLLFTTWTQSQGILIKGIAEKPFIYLLSIDQEQYTTLKVNGKNWEHYRYVEQWIPLFE